MRYNDAQNDSRARVCDVLDNTYSTYTIPGQVVNFPVVSNVILWPITPALRAVSDIDNSRYKAVHFWRLPGHRGFDLQLTLHFHIALIRSISRNFWMGPKRPLIPSFLSCHDVFFIYSKDCVQSEDTMSSIY